MPVTPGSVNEGGVPEGTSSDKTTGTQSFPGHPNNKNKKGISPLESREIFRGTLSSPDTHSFDTQYVVRPESYQSPRALLERGNGTRAAIIAQERNLSGKTLTPAEERRKMNPLLYSAEAEIARARQVAAFLESAKRRKSIRKPLTPRQVHFSRSPRLASPAKSIEQEEHAQGREESSDPVQDTVTEGPHGENRVPQLVDIAGVPSANQQDTDVPMPLAADPSTVDVKDNNAQPASQEAEEEEHRAVSPSVVTDQEVTVTGEAPPPLPSVPAVEPESVLETVTMPAEPDFLGSALGATREQDTFAPGPIERPEPDSGPSTSVDNADEATLSVSIQPLPVPIAENTEANEIEDPTESLLDSAISNQNEVEAIPAIQERTVEIESTETALMEIAPEGHTLTGESAQEKQIDGVSFNGNELHSV
jgi:hypothetical protein